MRPRPLHVFLLLAGLLLGAAPGSAAARVPDRCPAGTPTAATHDDTSVRSFDGTPIAITIFRPAGVCAARPTPVVLTLHGWSQTRARRIDQVADLLDHGYGVVSIDARGNGQSGGTGLWQSPDREIRDYRAVLDWIHDHLAWVQRQPASGIPKDIVVGARGSSFGGGFQLMLEAFDDRLDAIEPTNAWYDLPRSLAPNGAVKVYAELLWVSGKKAPHKRLDPRLDRWFALTLATNRLPPAARDSFAASSPSRYADRLTVPTLLTQGMTDGLFNLNEAVDTYRAVRRNGYDAWLVGAQQGHRVPLVQPERVVVGGTRRRGDAACDETARQTAGVDLDAVSLLFFDAFLRGDATARARLERLPRVLLATEQGGCVTGSDWPLASEVVRRDWRALTVPQGAGGALVPVITASAPMTVVGTPTLRFRVPAGADDLGFVSLVLRNRHGVEVVDDQVTGFRTGLPEVGSWRTIRLGAVATQLQPGDSLLLRLEGLNEQYLDHGNRRPGSAVLAHVRLELPVRHG